jgi:hypothetical protein
MWDLYYRVGRHRDPGNLCRREDPANASRPHPTQSRRWQCHHEAVLSVDRWPDHVPVPAFGPRMVCTRCGIIGADARPNWRERAGDPGTAGRAAANQGYLADDHRRRAAGACRMMVAGPVSPACGFEGSGPSNPVKSGAHQRGCPGHALRCLCTSNAGTYSLAGGLVFDRGVFFISVFASETAYDCSAFIISSKGCLGSLPNLYWVP